MPPPSLISSVLVLVDMTTHSQNLAQLFSPAFRQQIEAPLVQFDIDETIQNLTNVRDQLNGTSGAESIAQQTQYIIDGLTDLQNNQIPGIRAQVVNILF